MSKKNKNNSYKTEIRKEEISKEEISKDEIQKDKAQIDENPVVFDKKKPNKRKAIILSKRNGKTLVQIGTTQLVLNEIRDENIGEIIEL